MAKRSHTFTTRPTVLSTFRTALITVPLILSAIATDVAGDPVSFPGLHNTGVDDSGAVLAPGAVEPHYGLSGQASTAYVLTPHPAWIGAPSGSAWIGPAAGNQDGAEGQYVYDIQFDITGFDPQSAIVSGMWASDNNSVILLNGIDTGHANGLYGFELLTAFLISTGFVEGINTLTFDVTNHPYGGPNPTGLLVADIQGDAVVPVEPSTWGSIKSTFR